MSLENFDENVFYLIFDSSRGENANTIRFIFLLQGSKGYLLSCGSK